MPRKFNDVISVVIEGIVACTKFLQGNIFFIIPFFLSLAVKRFFLVIIVITTLYYVKNFDIGQNYIFFVPLIIGAAVLNAFSLLFIKYMEIKFNYFIIDYQLKKSKSGKKFFVIFNIFPLIFVVGVFPYFVGLWGLLILVKLLAFIVFLLIYSLLLGRVTPFVVEVVGGFTFVIYVLILIILYSNLMTISGSNLDIILMVYLLLISRVSIKMLIPILTTQISNVSLARVETK